MKIAIDLKEAGGEKAGKGWFTFYIVKNLLKLDQQNEYILYAKSGIPGFEEFKNAELKLIKGSGLFWHIKTAKDILKEKPDVFFAPTSYIILNLLPKSIKKITVVHDLVAFLFPKNHNKKAVLIEKLLLKRALKKSDIIISISENTKTDLLKKFKLDEKKIKIINCSAGEEFKQIDKSSLSPFIKKTNLPEKFFLAVGTIEPRKNYINLIKAFTIVNEKFPDYHLIIVGNNGWQYENIYKLIRENYLNKKVHILGYLSGKSLLNLYNLAKGFVFPSLYEGFGIPPLEAMKCGCPVIASNTSSIPEVVADAALLVNPENPKQIAQSMIKLIKDEELFKELQKKGLKQSKKFSWEASAKKLLKLITKLEY